MTSETCTLIIAITPDSMSALQTARLWRKGACEPLCEALKNELPYILDREAGRAGVTWASFVNFDVTVTPITGSPSPGPWHVDRNHIRNAEDDALASVPFTLGDEQDAANARLMAAAPDLLAALRELLAAGRMNYMKEMMDYEDITARAEDAILVATGESRPMIPTTDYETAIRLLMAAAIDAEYTLRLAGDNPSNDPENRRIYADNARALKQALAGVGDAPHIAAQLIDAFYYLLSSAMQTRHILADVTDQTSKEEMLKSCRFAARVMDEVIEDCQATRGVIKKRSPDHD